MAHVSVSRARPRCFETDTDRHITPTPSVALQTDRHGCDGRVARTQACSLLEFSLRVHTPRYISLYICFPKLFSALWFKKKQKQKREKNEDGGQSGATVIYSRTTVPPAASRAAFSFSASSLETFARISCGSDSTSFLAFRDKKLKGEKKKIFMKTNKAKKYFNLFLKSLK